VPRLSLYAVIRSAVAVPLAAAPAKSPFDGDARLNRTVTVSAQMRRVADVVKEVSDACGVQLQTDDEIADDTIVLLCRDQPAASVLTQLSETLEFTWQLAKGQEKAYRLVEDLASRTKRRRKLAEYYDRCAGPLHRYVAAMDKYAEELKDLQPKDRVQRFEQMRVNMEALPTGQERYTAELENSAAHYATDAESKPFYLAYKALPADARQRLLSGQRVMMATRRPGAVPMPPAVFRALQEGRQNVGNRQRGQVVEARQTEDEVIDFVPMLRYGRLVITARAPRLGDFPRPLTGGWPAITMTESNAHYGPPLVDAVPGEVTADRLADLRRPIKFEWIGENLDPKKPLSYFGGILPVDLLAVAQEKTPDLRFVGDSALDPMRPMPPRLAPESPALEPPSQAIGLFNGPGRAGQLPLGDMLREIARRTNVSFHVRSDGWIRCRSTLYFKQRSEHVDETKLQQLFEPVVTSKSLRPEDAVRICSALSQSQVRALGREFLAFLLAMSPFTHGFADTWRGWRLIGALTPDHRDVLYGGGTLRYLDLSPSEKRAADQFIQDSALGSESALDLELTPRDLPALTLKITELMFRAPPVPVPVPQTFQLELNHPAVSYALTRCDLRAHWRKPSVP
jgi:hypothetical protein